MDVTSFGINHDVLLRGIYVSRVDSVDNGKLTTFDVRMKEPNRESVLDTSVMHTLEHLMAVYLRGHKDWAEKTIYVGPMGCRTGMYVIFKGELAPSDILPIMQETYKYIVDFNGEIPATKS
ncbi:MAG: S-ribosylhomocysteine lyase, partial [Christensenellaceae bacterium]